MSLRYADTSALARCYFPDEPDHAGLKTALLGGVEPVVTSELTRLELESTVAAAHRSGRVSVAEALRAAIDTDCGPDGPVTLLRMESDVVCAEATRLVTRYPLRSLDALHLAVARTTAVELAGDEPVVLVTRDHRQAAAARELGMTVE